MTGCVIVVCTEAKKVSSCASFILQMRLPSCGADHEQKCVKSPTPNHQPKRLTEEIPSEGDDLR